MSLRTSAITLLRPLRKTMARARMAYYGRVGTVPSPEQWVFVVGCYNSGTTLLHDLIATHPDVSSLPREGQFCTDQLPSPAALGLPRLWALRPELFVLDENDAAIDTQRMKRQWGAHFADPGARVLLEKTTINAARMRWLQRNFENACFIGIIRNGYAVCEGIRRKAGHPLALCAEQWRRSNEIMLEQFGHLERHLLTTYEELSTRPEPLLREICNFLGIPAITHDLSGRSWTIHERTGQISDMNAKSIDRLQPGEISEINSHAADLLRRFGYYINP